MPKWAKNSPQRFFDAATRYEDKGNRRYKEIELSLPNELTPEQNREIIERFIANHLAIHEKAGEFDDVERISERPAYKYFRRAAKQWCHKSKKPRQKLTRP